MSDNDANGGATPSHQFETQAIDTKLWGPGTSSEGEDQLALPIPPHMEEGTRIEEEHNDDMPGVEGRAVWSHHAEEKGAA